MDLRDYFHRRCSEMLVMEREIWQIFSLMTQECWYPGLKGYFEQHNEPKRQQISSLEQIVDDLGGIIGPLEHPTTQSLRRMHRQFLELNPPEGLIEVDDALDADKLNALAVTAYAGLLLLARNLGEEGFARLLEHNLRAGEAMRAALQQLLPQVLADFGEQMRFAA